VRLAMGFLGYGGNEWFTRADKVGDVDE
jgi:hypothetical protein